MNFTSQTKPDSPVLQVENLVKHFGTKRVVDGVSLTLHPGRVLGLLGANGAGKTTTLRMCYGFLTPEAGSIRVHGHDLSTETDEAKRHLGVCTQDDTFDSDFSVRDNLKLMGTCFRPRPGNLAERVEDLLDRFGLRDFADAKPDTLSGGYRRRLMIARALVHEPRILFLDEPTTGLDPKARMGVWDLIAELKLDGLAIVLTTHYMDEAERLSDELVVLQEGNVVATGTSDSVLGSLVGEHVVVIDEEIAGLPLWLEEQGLPAPSLILGQGHLALDAGGLAAFTQRFPEARFEVRVPTLDDLFLKLADAS